MGGMMGRMGGGGGGGQAQAAPQESPQAYNDQNQDGLGRMMLMKNMKSDPNHKRKVPMNPGYMAEIENDGSGSPLQSAMGIMKMFYGAGG